MIYPSQETEIKNFLDDLLKEHSRAIVRREPVEPECSVVRQLIERAKELRAQLDIWTIIPEEEAVRAGS